MKSHYPLYYAPKFIIVLTLLFIFHKSNGQNWVSPIDIGGNYSTGYINDIECINSTLGYAVGHDHYNPKNAKILKTTDGGQTWKNTYPLLGKILRRIKFLDENTGWITGENGCILKTTNGGANWIDQSIPTKISAIFGIAILDNQKVFICGDSGLFKTLDGGATWSKVGPYNWINTVQFTSQSVGYTISSSGSILKTTDGGNTWAFITSLNGMNLNFYNDSIGWAYGWGPGANPSLANIYKTTNGGSTWKAQTNSADGYLSNGYVVSKDTVILIGESGVIMKTFDGGTTWVKSRSAETVGYLNTYALFSVGGFSKDNLWIVGAQSYMRRSRDAGTTWTTQNIGSNKAIYSIQYCKTDKNKAFAVGTTVIKSLSSNNGGKNWTQVTNMPGTTGYGCAYLDINNLLVSSDSGIYMSNNSGGSWVRKYAMNPPTAIYKLYFYDNNLGWAVGDRGLILKTSDAGQSWTKQTSNTTKFLNSIYFTSPTNGFAVGDSNIMIKTNDGGLTWTPYSGISCPYFNEIIFTSSSNGWIVGSDGSIFKTTDGGSSWTKPNYGIPTSEFLLGIKFSNSTDGWIYGFNTVLYKTIDNGATWIKQTSNVVNDVYAMDFNSDGTGLLAGGYGLIQIGKCISPVPSASDTQTYSNGEKISDLTVSGTSLKWYSDASLTNILSSTTLLTDNTTYYVTQTMNGCESDPKAIFAKKCTSPAPAGSTIQYFNTGDKISNLVVTGSDLKWYTNSTLTSPTNATTALINNKIYYVTQTINNCESPPLSITAKLNTNQNIILGHIEQLYLIHNNEYIQIANLYEKSKVDIYNIDGTLIHSCNISKDDIIPTSYLASGLYIITIKSKNVSLKFMKN